jgi:4-amino-4-deoxy-L-arabinose transferase-like glycosyltransferase
MLLAVTALLYLFGLSASGYANTYYAAAVQAATRSWKAFFFGSSDAANFITVDKPPLSLWPSALAARVFGVNPWTVLAPQALEGVASVGVLYATVRRWFAPQAALLAGAVLALTPVAALMFRFNNPDALLTLLLVLGAYATVRALERAGTGWLLLAASCLGLGFLTKMLQALLVVPAFALVYGIAAPTSIRRRLVQFALAGIALVASAGWWVAIVELVPASARPYIGGSQTNSVLELIFGYNGFGRLTGNQVGSVGGAMGWGQTGWARLVGAEVGGQIAWLLPAALILLAGGLWLHRRAPRTDRTRAALLLWGGWLLVTGLVFSFMRGIFHAYYTVALAPAIGALVGIGAVALWRQREHAWARLTLAGAVAATGVWSYVLLQRTPAWLPWLAPVVLLGGLLAALAVAGLLSLRLGRGALAAVVAGALVVVLAGPAAYAVQTAATPHGGAIPSAGPATAVGFGIGGFPRSRPGRRAPVRPPDAARRSWWRWASRWIRGRRGPGWPAQRQRAERRTGGVAAAGRWRLHLGGRDRRGQLGCRDPAHHRRSRLGHRRVQRHGPDAHARAVPAVRARGQDPLLHPRRRRTRWRVRHRQPSNQLGGRALHRRDRRRSHRLRPDRPGHDRRDHLGASP